MIKKIILMVFLLTSVVSGNNEIFVISNNFIDSIDYDYKIVLNDNVKELIYDGDNIYFNTENFLYINNKSTGQKLFKIRIINSSGLTQDNNYVYLKSNNKLYKINKSSGNIDITKKYDYINNIYSGIINTFNNFYINVFGEPQMNSISFIAGNNINLSQDTNNKTITITGSNTWTFTDIDMIENSYIGSGNDYISNVIQFLNQSLKQYSYQISSNLIGSIVTSYNHIYLYTCYYDTSDCLNHEIDIYNNEVDINANTNIEGNVIINGINLENKLNRTSIKSFQADFSNSSEIYNDIVIIPQDLKLTNITVLIINQTNKTDYLLNLSIERFVNYPNETQTILSLSFNQSINYLNGIYYNFNNNDVVILNYTEHINISKATSMFKFKDV